MVRGYGGTEVRRYEGTRVRGYEGMEVRGYEGTRVRGYEGTKEGIDFQIKWRARGNTGFSFFSIGAGYVV
jgi:hypothetical protein